METYRLFENNRKVLLKVEPDTAEEYADYFVKSFLKGLQVIKELPEKQTDFFFIKTIVLKYFFRSFHL